MAAKSNNGPIIGMAIFAVLSVLFAVFWYMGYSDNQNMVQQLGKANNDSQNAKGIITDLNAQIEELKRLLGQGTGKDVGLGDESAGTVLGDVKAYLTQIGADSGVAPANTDEGLRSTHTESVRFQQSANHRQTQFVDKIREMDAALSSKDQEIASHKKALDDAQLRLVEKETIHSEEMEKAQQENQTLRTAKVQLETDIATLRVEKDREIEDLQGDINLKREAIVSLRSQLREKEDPNFASPDGRITNVDPEGGLCSVDIGSADGLRTGITFSVYKQRNSGVGRRTTDDIKGKIEIVEILGPNQAEGRIVDQKNGAPISTDDPIFSPIFQAGQSMEVVICGRISVNGLDRDQFRRLVSTNGARIAVEVDGNGDFVDGRGNIIDSEEEAEDRITSRTRLVVIADIGDDAAPDDEVLAETYEKIRRNSQSLRERALNLGIYEIGLSTFLEHIGYSRKQMAWKPESPYGYPGMLANGAKSRSARSKFGKRVSSAVISGKFSGRDRDTSVSSGITSGVYRSN